MRKLLRLLKGCWSTVKGCLLAVWRWLYKRCARLPWSAFLRVGCALLCVGILLGSMGLILSSAVRRKTQERILTAEQISALGEDFDCILVLGCLVRDDGSLSHMLEDRVTVGVSLYHAGICDTLLMSGDHQSDSYNEVDPMKAAAEAMGVPTEAILTDPLGLSTYDSIKRVLSEFEGKRIVIVTQQYHLYRALYVAEKLGLDAYGVSADLRPYSKQWTRDVREVLARCKDVYFALKQP